AVRRLVRDRAFQDEVAVLVLVEAELDEGADIAAALRRAVDDRVPDRVAQRVVRQRPGGRTGTVPAAVRGVIIVIVLPAALAGARAGGLVGGRSRQVLGACRGAVQDVFGPYAVGDLAAVAVPGDRQPDLQAGRQVALPAVIRERISLALQQAIAGVAVGRAAD